MSVKLIFKIQAIINLINGLGALFLTQFFLEQANFEVTADISTLAEFVGVTFLILALISWRIPDIAGAAINSFGIHVSGVCLLYHPCVEFNGVGHRQETLVFVGGGQAGQAVGGQAGALGQVGHFLRQTHGRAS